MTLKQSSVPEIRYLIIDGVNCGIVDSNVIVLRKRVSESRLAIVLAEVGERRIVGPPAEIPEEYY